MIGLKTKLSLFLSLQYFQIKRLQGKQQIQDRTIRFFVRMPERNGVVLLQSIIQWDKGPLKILTLGLSEFKFEILEHL